MHVGYKKELSFPVRDLPTKIRSTYRWNDRGRIPIEPLVVMSEALQGT